MQYIGALIIVTDMERSKAFYKKHLGLEVVTDFGANVTLSGGISLQTLETWRGFINGLDVNFKSNNAELYFETADFTEFCANLEGLDLVHPPIEHRWGQHVVRFRDPDGHIIEVGEMMSTVARRFFERGMCVTEVAARMDVREEYVRAWLEGA